MSQSDLMKFFSRYDSEVTEADFTPEEIDECKKRYVDFYDDIKEKKKKKQDW